MADSVYDPELLRSQILEFVDYDSAEVCRIEIRNAVMSEDQFRKPWQIVVGETSFRLSPPFQLQCCGVPDPLQLSFNRRVMKRLLLCLSKQVLDSPSIIPGGVALTKLLSNPVVLGKDQLIAQTYDVRVCPDQSSC